MTSDTVQMSVGPSNASEVFVYHVCQKSFLSLWSYANPLGKNDKELCDILVVCEPDVIIFSVKDVKPTESGDIQTDWKRWIKRAIEESCKQIYGAERWIRAGRNVIRNDGAIGLPIPQEPTRRVHRVAVALGGGGNMPLRFGDLGKGFVHVFDDTSFRIFLNELDTVTDFVKHLVDKEALYESGVKTVFQGREEDLLAFYLYKGRKFPMDFKQIIVGDKLWESHTRRVEIKAKKREDLYSYYWDNLIEILCRDILAGNLEFSSSLTDSEITIRQMARENRLSRRMLGKGFIEFLEASSNNKIRSRIMEGLSDVAYVLLATPCAEDRQGRVEELELRCLVARGLRQNCKTVVGIATEQYKRGSGFSLDVVYMYKESWTQEDQGLLETIQKQLGYFQSPLIKSVHYDEYPSN